MKFGGTSVANFEAITRTIFIIGSKLDQKPVVVVSALSKITDLLYKIADCAAVKDFGQTQEALAMLRERHLNLVKELLEQSPMYFEQATARVNEICDELDHLVFQLVVGDERDVLLTLHHHGYHLICHCIYRPSAWFCRYSYSIARF